VRVSLVHGNSRVGVITLRRNQGRRQSTVHIGLGKQGLRLGLEGLHGIRTSREAGWVTNSALQDWGRHYRFVYNFIDIRSLRCRVACGETNHQIRKTRRRDSGNQGESHGPDRRGRLMLRTLRRILVGKKRRIPKPAILVDAAVAIALAFPLAVHATDGSLSNTCGAKAQGIGGVGIASIQPE
jgi:hypothetical protein